MSLVLLFFVFFFHDFTSCYILILKIAPVVIDIL